MEHEFAHRRRSSIMSAEPEIVTAVHVSMPVRLLRVTSDSLLLACRVPLRIGSTVRLAAEFAGRRLEVELCVDHVSNRPDEAAGGYVLGGRLPPADLAAWRRITALLAASVPPVAAEPAPWAA